VLKKKTLAVVRKEVKGGGKKINSFRLVAKNPCPGRGKAGASGFTATGLHGVLKRSKPVHQRLAESYPAGVPARPDDRQETGDIMERAKYAPRGSRWPKLRSLLRKNATAQKQQSGNRL